VGGDEKDQAGKKGEGAAERLEYRERVLSGLKQRWLILQTAAIVHIRIR